MYHIFRNIELFKESKNLGTLYHIVDTYKLDYILDNNKMSSHHIAVKENTISFTRDKTLNYILSDYDFDFFKIMVDGEKLSQNYKIRPYVHKHNKTSHFRREKEELVIITKGDSITNIKNYITGIIIIKEKLDNYLYYYGAEKDNAIKGISKTLKRIINEENIPIYVQSGSIIKKNDVYVNNIIEYKHTYDVKISIIYKINNDQYITLDKDMNIYKKVNISKGKECNISDFGLIYIPNFFISHTEEFIKKRSEIIVNKLRESYNKAEPHIIEIIKIGKVTYVNDIYKFLY